MTRDLSDGQLLRYSRHILLAELGIEGQQRLLDAHALVIGAGGLGSPALLYLGSAGVGRITVVDPDVVDLTNLQRQIAHNQQRIGMAKAESAAQAVAELNADPQLRALVARADEALLDTLLPDVDVVLDCTDNFATRQAVNAACVRHAVPLVSGAAVRMDAQLCVIDPRDAQCACYACVFPADEPPEEERCATLGVFAPLVGIIGAMQAAEALKLLARCGEPLAGRLLMLDARTMEWTRLRTARRPACPVCGHRPLAGAPSA